MHCAHSVIAVQPYLVGGSHIAIRQLELCSEEHPAISPRVAAQLCVRHEASSMRKKVIAYFIEQSHMHSKGGNAQ